MNKKRILILVILIIIILIGIVLLRKRKKVIHVENEISERIKVSNVVQDEQTGEYVIYNLETGEEIARSEDEVSLYIYTLDPNYDPKSSASDE
ncbi:MAG: hypothetical protein IJ867_07460 [Clostridia bacterium]|nr:hypothetical protein [Clostridia bacterium]